MKTKRLTIFLLIFAFLLTNILVAQERIERKIEKKLEKIDHDLREKEHLIHSIEIPEIHVDLSRLEQSMKHLEVSLQHLEHIEIPEIEIDIPEICVDIPHIHIPEIELDFSEFDFDFDFDDCFIYCHEDDGDRSDLFEDLSEDEQLRVSALRSLGRQNTNKAIPAIEKFLKEEANPALRYEAVRQLRNFFDDERVVPILGKVAKTDKNIDVRKKAIRLLGKSNDKRAVKILEQLSER